MKKLLVQSLFVLSVGAVAASEVAQQLNAIISRVYFLDADIMKFQAIVDQNESEASKINWGVKPFTPKKLQSFFGDFRVQAAVSYGNEIPNGMAKVFEGYHQYALKAILGDDQMSEQTKLEAFRKMYTSATYYARRSITRALSKVASSKEYQKNPILRQFQTAETSMKKLIERIGNDDILKIITSSESPKQKTADLLDLLQNASAENQRIILNNILNRADLISEGTLADDPIRSACAALVDPTLRLLTPVEQSDFRYNLRFVLKNRIKEIGQLSSDEDLKNVPEDIFGLLTGSFFDEEYLDPQEFSNPTIKAVVQAVGMRGMLFGTKVPEAKEFKVLEEALNSSEMFEKYPKLWFAIARSLTDTIVEGLRFANIAQDNKNRLAQLDKIQKLLQRTAPAKEGSGGKGMMRWFRDHCNFARLRLNIMSRLSYRNNESRYAAVSRLLDAFNKDQVAQESVVLDASARQVAIESIVRQVGVMLQGLNGKNKVAGQPERLLSQLNELDPEGKIIYREVMRGLNASVRREFVATLSRIQNRVGSSGQSSLLDQPIILPSDDNITDELLLEGLRPAEPVTGSKEPVMGGSTRGSSVGSRGSIGSGRTGGSRSGRGEQNEQEREIEEGRQGGQVRTGEPTIQETSVERPR